VVWLGECKIRTLQGQLEMRPMTETTWGPGILELGRFNNALWLRWQWMTWKNNNKPCSGIVIPSSRTELALFRACSKIIVRNNTSTSFWDDQWLQGQAPRQLAPVLNKLAWRKKISVAQACREGRWMRGLQRITTTEEITQFITLWTFINNVQLSDFLSDGS
jgi:hypothetical protein